MNMKRPWLILLGGVGLAFLAYAGSYLAGSARSRSMEQSQAPELSWLQKEYHLSDSEFTRVAELHKSYYAACAERCAKIDAKNAELKKLLSGTNTVTPEIEQTMQAAAQLRADCQKAMLQHFYEISRTMPAAHGKRYFDWVVNCTFGSEHASMMTHASPDADHEHHRE
jgi:hypothetical protein